VKQPKTDKMTAEFWFRFPSATDGLSTPNYLFTMSRASGLKSEFMTIYVDADGLLKCAPFGINSDPSTILVYKGIKVYTIDKWQHVSCMYDQDRTISG